MARLEIGTAALVYKLIAVVSSLLAIAGTGRAAQRLGRDPIRAVTLIGLNPVLLVYAVGGAHNDLIMLAALVWSIVALAGRRAWAGGALIVAAIAVKLTAGIMLPFALVKPRQSGHGRISAVLIGAAVALVIVTAVTAAMFGASPLRLLNTLAFIQARGGKQSVPGFIAYGLGLGTLSRLVTGALAACLVGCVLALLYAVRVGRLDWITATGWAIVALLLTTTFLLPWYAIWLLPFAALSDSRGLRWAALVLTAIGLTSL